MNELIENKLEDGTIKWRLPNGELHNDHGPAIEWSEGTYEWYQNGRLHREDGPAVVQTNECRWYWHGKMHRIGGPAVIRSNGMKKYWLDDKEYDPVAYLIKCYERTN